ncbi:hypothetical protein GXW82_41855 [Streptacidiphilus sp. 4-A2]|nr:hypothetical protein [Streptacidiphilus sp. 4-A2]
MSLEATRAWPVNDTGFGFEVYVLSQNPFVITKQLVSFPVGTARTGVPSTSRSPAVRRSRPATRPRRPSPSPTAPAPGSLSRWTYSPS